MLSRPTTEQIILDCRTQLLEIIAPAVDAEPVQIAIQMMENVLRNVAERSAHEIAWMREECDAAVAYARGVATTGTGNSASASNITDALGAYEAGRSESLHLDDVVVTYDLAGRCLTAAIEAAMANGDDAAHIAGRALLDQRLAHENQIMGEWTMVGRA